MKNALLHRPRGRSRSEDWSARQVGQRKSAGSGKQMKGSIPKKGSGVCMCRGGRRTGIKNLTWQGVSL